MSVGLLLFLPCILVLCTFEEQTNNASFGRHFLCHCKLTLLHFPEGNLLQVPKMSWAWVITMLGKKGLQPRDPV